MLRVFMMIGLLLGATNALAQGWEVVAAPEGYRARWAAEVKNEQGQTLRVWRFIEKTKFLAYAEVVIPGFQFAAPEGEMRVDDEQFHAIERWRDKTARIEGNAMRWQLWASTTNVLGENDAPQQWMRGNRIEFRFKDKKGNVKDVAFTLEGSSSTMDRVIQGTYK